MWLDSTCIICQRPWLTLHFTVSRTCVYLILYIYDANIYMVGYSNKHKKEQDKKEEDILFEIILQKIPHMTNVQYVLTSYVSKLLTYYKKYNIE